VKALRPNRIEELLFGSWKPKRRKFSMQVYRLVHDKQNALSFILRNI